MLAIQRLKRSASGLLLPCGPPADQRSQPGHPTLKRDARSLQRHIDHFTMAAVKSLPSDLTVPVGALRPAWPVDSITDRRSWR
jgi:hypothetical protein